MIEHSKSTLVEDELEASGVYASTTSGVSMEPLFKTRRDVVIIAKPTGELKKYDVGLYRSPTGKYILHRVIKVLEDEYLIRGDNTYVIEHIAKDRIIGVLVEFNRKGKRQKCTDKSYIAYCRFWNFIYPIRFVFYHARRFFGRVFRKLKSLFKGKNKEDNK